MPLTPENAQKLTNLQQRVLANIAAGKNPADGIERADLTEALNLLRGDRARALAAGETKKGGGRKKAAANPPAPGKSLAELMAAKGMDISKLQD